MKLPRVRNALTQDRSTVWRQCCENMAAHLLFESLRAFRTGHPLQGFKNLAMLPRLNPLAILSLARDRFFHLTPRRSEEIVARLRTKHEQMDI